MKNKLKNLFLFIIIGGLVVINWYDHYVLTARRMETFAIAPLTIINVYITRPFLWTWIGIFVMSLLLERFTCFRDRGDIFKVCRKIGVSIMIVYYGCVCIVLFCSECNIANRISSVLVQSMIDNFLFFVFLGLLIGAGCPKGETKNY